MSQRWLPLVLLAVACGGGPAPVSPSDVAATPDQAVRSFMQAVADSNIARMAQFWGTSRGPAGVTHEPADQQQRMVVTQVYLRATPYRITGLDPVGNDANRMTVRVELDRRDPDGTTCVRAVPFGTVKAGKHGWIVNAIDLNLAGPPGYACAAPKAAN